MTTVAFVGGDADRCGRTVQMLELVGWVRRQHPDVDVEVVLLEGGPLMHRFHALAPTAVVEWYDRREDQKQAALVLRNARRRSRMEDVIERVETRALARRLTPLPADVVILDGMDALESGWNLLHRSPDVARLADVTAGRLARLAAGPRQMLRSTGTLLVTSERARRDLEVDGVAESRIVVHPRLAPSPTEIHDCDRTDRVGPVIVGGWGPVDCSSGADLFVRLAWLVRQNSPDLGVAFRWAGCARRDFAPIQAQATAAGLADGDLAWAGDLDLGLWLASIDICTSTDRVPGSAVIDLAAAADGVPCVAFAADVATDRRVRVVPYPDVGAMAHEVVRLSRATTGPFAPGGAADHDPAQHSVEVVGPQIWAEVQRCVGR